MDLRKEAQTPWQIGYLNAGLYFGQHKVQNKDQLREKEVLSDDWDVPALIRLQEPSERQKLLGILPYKVIDPGGYSPEEPECGGASYDRVKRLFASNHMTADPALGIVCNMNTILDGSLPGRSAMLLMSLLRLHKDEIRRECQIVEQRFSRLSLRTRNLFLPISVGGMGVKPPPGWKYKISYSDRVHASNIFESSSLQKTTQRPLPGYEAVVVDEIARGPWTKPVAEERITHRRVSTTERWLKPREFRVGLEFFSNTPSTFTI